MQKVEQAIGPFPGDSEKFVMLEIPHILRMLGCQVSEYWGYWMSGMLCAGMVDTGDTWMLKMLES